MNQQSFNYVPAKNDDVRRLPRLLALHPEHVLVRDAFGSLYSLTTLVRAPFITRPEGGYIVLSGVRLTDKKTVYLRIYQYHGEPVLQWKDSLQVPWRLDADWAPVHQLYVPDTVLV